MKVYVSLFGLLLVFLLVSYLESPNKSDNLAWHSDLDSDTEEVTSQEEALDIPTYSSLEYILEDTKRMNGYYIEIYREYEIYTDDNGNITDRIPTSNYNYLRHKL